MFVVLIAALVCISQFQKGKERINHSEFEHSLDATSVILAEEGVDAEERSATRSGAGEVAASREEAGAGAGVRPQAEAAGAAAGGYGGGAMQVRTPVICCLTDCC